MTSITWNAEGGSDGTAISTGNSGGSSGTAWDTCQRGTSATNEYDSAQFANGALSALLATAGTSTTAYNRWNAGITALWASGLTTHYGRMYFRLAALPAANRVICEFLDTTAATNRANIQILTTGAVRLRNAASGTVATTSTLISANTWYRLEYRIDGSTTGAYELHLYAGNSSTSLEDIVGGTANFGGTIGAAGYGYVANGASLASLWFDDIQINDVALPGPASAGSIAPTGLAAAVALGSPTVSQSMAVTPAGLAVAVGLGQTTASQTFATTPTGIATAVALGTPAVSQAQVVAPAGLSATAALGALSISQAMSVAPDGLATTALPGTPALAQTFTVAPTGIATTIALGAPTVAFVPARNLNLAIGWPTTKWHAGQPRTKWQTGPPQTKWHFGPPTV